MKPRIGTRMAATREAAEKAFGPRLGALFVTNPDVDEYAVVLRFPDTKVISSDAMRRALRKLACSSGAVLVVARDLTLEARRVAGDAGCDVLTPREFGWTDESYARIRKTSSR